MPSPLQSWNNGSHWNLGKTLVCAILYYYLLPCLCCWKQLFRLLSETMMMVDLAVWIDQVIIMNDQDKKPAIYHYQLITPT
jgi:hypothetical protein